MWISIAIITILLVLVVLYYWIYNQLVAARETIDEAFATIDVQLKKRFDLVPRLVSVTKAYSDYESKLFNQITELRRTASETIQKKEKEDACLNLISNSIKMTVENYPALKANEHFLKLMSELSSIEEELAMARRYLNGTIRDYNTKIDIFPHVLIAKRLGFTEHSFYEIEPYEKEPQKIFE
jgi:LemA protein